MKNIKSEIGNQKKQLQSTLAYGNDSYSVSTISKNLNALDEAVDADKEANKELVKKIANIISAREFDEDEIVETFKQVLDVLV